MGHLLCKPVKRAFDVDNVMFYSKVIDQKLSHVDVGLITVWHQHANNTVLAQSLAAKSCGY